MKRTPPTPDFPQTPPAHRHTLIINDGSLGGLIACWSEGVVRPTLVPGAPSAAASGLTAWMPADDRPCHARRRAAVERQVEACALAGWSDRQLIRADKLADAVSDALASGARCSVMLLNACLEARARGISRIIWPIHVGGSGWSGNGGGGGNSDRHLEDLAAASDRALLISQLMVVDSAGSHAPGQSPALPVRVDMPYLDFTDAQMMDLALDLDAPLGACWWCVNDQETPCEQCAQCMRWREALICVDPARALTIQSVRATTNAAVV